MSEHSLKHNGSKTTSRRTSQASKTSSRKLSQTSKGSKGSKASKASLPKICSSGSSEEGAAIESEVKFSFFTDYPEIKPTLSDYKRKNLGDEPLFPTVVTLDSKDDILEQKIDTSFLVKGFGMRNLKSLQDALRDDEKKRLLELYRYQQKQLEEERLRALLKPKFASSFTSSSCSEKSEAVTKQSTETGTSTTETNISEQKLHFEYLMGLKTLGDEEETVAVAETEEKSEVDDFIYSTSGPMRNAQKYLRVHRIFDFFQFIIAHLLGGSPENPIGFIIELLNKCLLYRSGMGEPPLLYEKRHIAQLFCLMDRMGTGFIEMEQYTRGMATLGICDYNKHPRSTEDGMVDKETFIEEVYDAELALFQDLIGRKWIGKKPRRRGGDKVVYQDDISKDDSVPYFLPPELFRSYKKKEEKLVEIKEEEEEFYGA